MEVDGGAGEVVADEVAAVVDVEHVRQAAHRPRRVGLVPDRLPQRQRSVHRRGRTEKDGVAADRAGAIVNDRRQPRPGGLAVGAHHEDVEQRVVARPHRIRVLGLPAQHQLVLVTVGPRALQGESDHSRIQGRHDRADHAVGRHRPPTGTADTGDPAVESGDRGAGFAQRQALDQPHEFRGKMVSTGIRALSCAQARIPVNAVAGVPALQGAQPDPGLAGQGGQRDAVLDVQPQDAPPRRPVHLTPARRQLLGRGPPAGGDTASPATSRRVGRRLRRCGPSRAHRR